MPQSITTVNSHSISIHSEQFPRACYKIQVSINLYSFRTILQSLLKTFKNSFTLYSLTEVPFLLQINSQLSHSLSIYSEQFSRVYYIVQLSCTIYLEQVPTQNKSPFSFTLSNQNLNNPQVWVQNNNSTLIHPLSTALQPLYNMIHYNMVFDIIQFKDGSQKCIIILKNDHKWSFFNIIYTFLFGNNTVV